jgi:hypothetical protein
MRILKSSLLLSALVLTAACGNDDKKADRAAYDDMMLPRPAAQQVISAEELGLAAPVATPLAAQPEVKPVAATPRRTTTARRSTSTASRSSGSGTYTPAPQRTTTIKHTKRDAAIGAAAGAVIGGVATGKVKGAVIGGVLGGVAGAVIGNNVDVKKVPQY